MTFHLDPELEAKVIERRGRRHAFERLDARGTALVAIDLTEASVAADQANVVEAAEATNEAARIVRAAGGVVAWVRPGPVREFDHVLAAVVGPERAGVFAAQSQSDNPLSKLWRGLELCETDLHAMKSGWSAFFPGKCDLHPRLQAMAIENVLIAGTVTNVCCESSARDAVELGYRVTMIADANAGHSYGLHEASLATFYRIFGDVRPSSDLNDLLRS